MAGAHRSLALALTLSSVALLSTSALPAVAAPIELVLLGDSITAGAVSGPAGPSYAELLPDMLGPDFAVTNIGCGGSSSFDWTLSIGSRRCGGTVMDSSIYEALARANMPAHLVTILLGSNDAAGYFEPRPIAPLEYGGALLEIIDNLLLDGADQILLMTAPQWGRHVDDEIGQRLQHYRDIVQVLCTNRDSVLCGPDLYTLLDLDDHFDGVNVHPNAAGHLVIAQKLSQSILAVVPESGRTSLISLVVIALALRIRCAA